MKINHGLWKSRVDIIHGVYQGIHQNDAMAILVLNTCIWRISPRSLVDLERPEVGCNCTCWQQNYHKISKDVVCMSIISQLRPCFTEITGCLGWCPGDWFSARRWVRQICNCGHWIRDANLGQQPSVRQDNSQTLKSHVQITRNSLMSIPGKIAATHIQLQDCFPGQI